jgi:hypothetical protein
MPSWLRSARSVLVPSGTENGLFPTRFRKRAMAARLSIERLEDRTVPSTFTVGNLADSGAGSLREAVLDANNQPGADLISVASGVRGTITLTGGELSITDDLILDGPGVNRLTISGNDASRVFSVSGSATAVEISDLTIAHGQATGTTAVGPLGPVTLGGGLLNTGAHVVISHVTLAANQAVGHIAQGGAIANVFGATLVVTDCTFAGNRADGSAGSRGGAISNEAGSTLVLERGTFTGNQATTALGTSPGIPGTGLAGAIGNAAGSQATVSYSTFDSNAARGGTGANGGPGQNGGNGGNGVGGAISNDATSFLVPFASSTITVAHATFLGNQAIGGIGGTGGNGGSGGNGSNGPGGAINNGGSTLTVTDSTFLGNQSLGGPGGNGGMGGNGGVGANGSGGAIQNANPPPALTGGALIRATLHVSDSLFLGNEAIGGAGGNGGSSGNGGAGGTGRGGGLINQFSDWDIRNTLFAFNQATGGAGGDRGSDGLLGGTGGAGRGGGLSNINGSIGTLFDSAVILNNATGGNGDLGGNGGNGQGGGVFNGGTSPQGVPSLTLLSSLITRNRADGGAAGLGQGGGLYLSPGGIAYADVGTTIFANDASTSDDDVFGNLANFP